MVVRGWKGSEVEYPEYSQRQSCFVLMYMTLHSVFTALFSLSFLSQINYFALVPCRSGTRRLLLARREPREEMMVEARARARERARRRGKRRSRMNTLHRILRLPYHMNDYVVATILDRKEWKCICSVNWTPCPHPTQEVKKK